MPYMPTAAQTVDRQLCARQQATWQARGSSFLCLFDGSGGFGTLAIVVTGAASCSALAALRLVHFNVAIVVVETNVLFLVLLMCCVEPCVVLFCAYILVLDARSPPRSRPSRHDGEVNGCVVFGRSVRHFAAGCHAHCCAGREHRHQCPSGESAASGRRGN
jgi:hypothetical protein